MERKIATKFFLKRQKRKRRKLLSFLILLFLIIIAGYFIFNYFNNNIDKSFLIDPFISASSKPTNNEITPVPKNPLEDIVKNALSGSKGDYAIFVKNLNTGESYLLNETKVYEAGSLYKLWVMAEAFQQIQEGLLTGDELLKDTIPNLNRKFNIGPKDAELTSGSIDMSVTEAIKQMIVISHNYAAMLLTDKIKVASITDFLKSANLVSSAIGSNEPSKTTAFDTALFLEKLYKGELANPEYSAQMLDILKAQTFDGGLPKYLPKEVIIANKTGDIDWFKHDAGITFTDKGDYIIVVMSESDSPAGAQERIALISKAVYEYFTK